jgi:PKD repeat protein
LTVDQAWLADVNRLNAGSSTLKVSHVGEVPTNRHDHDADCPRPHRRGQTFHPTAVASATPSSESHPLAVVFSSTGSNDLDGSIAWYNWGSGDGSLSVAADPSHTYANRGVYGVRLTLADDVERPAVRPSLLETCAFLIDGIRSKALPPAGTG